MTDFGSKIAELRKEATLMADKIDYDSHPGAPIMLSMLHSIRESLAIAREDLADVMTDQEVDQ